MYKAAAKRKFKYAEWIHGDGEYALAARCGCLTVTLHKTLEDARKSKSQIDSTGCGHACVCRNTDPIRLSMVHKIVKLQK